MEERFDPCLLCQAIETLHCVRARVCVSFFIQAVDAMRCQGPLVWHLKQMRISGWAVITHPALFLIDVVTVAALTLVPSHQGKLKK